MGVSTGEARRPWRDAAELPRRSAPAVAAWLAVLPSVAIVLLAMLLLGPPLEQLLAPSGEARFWPGIAWLVHPEPLEQARYVIALTGPLVLTAGTIFLVRRWHALSTPMAARAATAVEWLLAAGLALCLLHLRAVRLPRIYDQRGDRVVYFTLPTLGVAAAIALATVILVRRPVVWGRLAHALRDSRWRVLAAMTLALLLTAITILPAIVTESSVLAANDEFIYHVRFVYDEATAVLDGRSPLGDFAAQYGSLWPYLVAATMGLLGASIGTFTTAMAVLTGTCLLAVFALLRRVTRSALVALALFLPLLATSAYRLHGSSAERFSLVNYFGTMPLRYAGPFLLAWLLARHLDGAWPRRAWPLFVAGGLVAINNGDFGIPALGALGAALLWCEPVTASRLRMLGREAVLGLAAAAAAVTLLLLLRTGEAPHPELLFRYARLFAADGFGMLPMRPLFGLSTIVFATFVATIGVATVRALERAPDRLLTGLLAWSGVFGLGAGSYYVGRSIPEVLTNLFPAWALAVTLLTIVVVRGLAARAGRRPRGLELACLFAFGLLVCSLAQTPSPTTQLNRIASNGSRFFRHPPAEPFAAAHVPRGEPVAMLTELGHRVAFDLGLDDVTPYSGIESIQAEQQLDETLARLRAAGGTKVVLSTQFAPTGVREWLSAHGMRQATASAEGAFELWEAG
jgi:hypothetical protein